MDQTLCCRTALYCLPTPIPPPQTQRLASIRGSQYSEAMHNFNIDNEDIEIVKILLTLVQTSIPMETVARKSREG